MSFDEDDMGMDIDVLPLEIDDAIVALIRDDRVTIPPVPAVALELQALLAKDARTDVLADVVGRDQVLSATVLRAANGARFGAGREVTSIRGALARVGTKELTTLAFASALAGSAGKAGPLFEVRRVLWQRGLAASVLCRDIATEMGTIDPATAQMCGLLYDFGRLFAVGAVETVLVEHQHAQALVLDDWLRVIEKFHAELGIVVAARWNLPSPVAESMTCMADSAAAGVHQPVVDMVGNVSALVDSLFQSSMAPPSLMERLVCGKPGALEGCTAAINQLPPKLAALVEASRLTLPKKAVASQVMPMAAAASVTTQAQTRATAELQQSAEAHPVLEMGDDTFTIASAAPYSENYVVEARFIVAGEQPITLFTTVTASTPSDASGHMVDLKLFCASAAQRRNFRAAVMAAKKPDGTHAALAHVSP